MKRLAMSAKSLPNYQGISSIQGSSRLHFDHVIHIIDTRAARGVKRSQAAVMGLRMEQEASAFHARVREGFLDLARNEPQRIRVIDARGSVDDVQREIRAAVDGFLRRGPSGRQGRNLP